MSKVRFSDRKIEQLAPTGREYMVFDAEQTGLAIRVTLTGSKTYLAQFTVKGRRRRVPLGPCKGVKLADARKAVAKMLGEIALNGTDPAEARLAERAAEQAKRASEQKTLQSLVENWAALQLVRRRPGYRHEAVRALRHAFHAQWERPVEELTRGSILRVVDGLVRDGKTAMAGRTVAYANACFTWAIRRGEITSNPFALLPAIERSPSRDRVLTDAELVAVSKAATEIPAPFGPIVQLLILTGQRRNEVGGIAWGELTDDLLTWIIPAARIKTGRLGGDHSVPLSPAGRDIIASALRLSDRLVYPGRVSDKEYISWGDGKALLDRLSGVKGWTLHDLRRTLATGLQRLGVRLEVTEAVLNHKGASRDGIIGVYQRYDWANEKRAALEAWADHVRALVDGIEPNANVVTLRA